MPVVLIIFGLAISIFSFATFTRVSLFGVSCYASSFFSREVVLFGVPTRDPLCLPENIYLGITGSGGFIVLLGLVLLFRQRGVSKEAQGVAGNSIPPATLPPQEVLAGRISTPELRSRKPLHEESTPDRDHVLPPREAPARRTDQRRTSAVEGQDLEHAVAAIAYANIGLGEGPDATKIDDGPAFTAWRTVAAGALVALLLAEAGVAYYLFQLHRGQNLREAELAEQGTALAQDRERLKQERAEQQKAVASAKAQIEGERKALADQAASIDLSRKGLEEDRAAWRAEFQATRERLQREAEKAAALPPATTSSAPQPGPAVTPSAPPSDFATVTGPAQGGTGGGNLEYTAPAPQAPTSVMPAQLCDLLAANPSDRQRVSSVPGVSFGVLRKNPAPAIAACQDAVRSAPQELRFAYQLARATQAIDLNQARELLKPLIRAQYPSAFDNMANILIQQQQNYAAAAHLLRLGAKLGDPDSTIDLAGLIDDGHVPASYPNEMVALYERAAREGNPNAARRLQELSAQGRVNQDVVRMLRSIIPTFPSR